MSTHARPSIQLPEDTIDLRGELVPAVRAFLHRGLSDAFLRQCVRIGAYASFSGGQKATLVGALRIDVNAAVKLGGPELEHHQQLMEAVNEIRKDTFPAIVERTALDDGRVILLMANLRRHETLLSLVYRRGLARDAHVRIIRKVIAGLRAVREAGVRLPDVVARSPRQPLLLGERLRSKITAVLGVDPELARVATTSGTMMGVPCPPIEDLLASVDDFVKRTAPQVQPTLQHGDPHLGNVLVRRSGRGYAVTLIDPNPEVGFADPLYDVGKMLHFAEPVGWALLAPERCTSTWRSRRTSWTLDADHSRVNRAAERQRQTLMAHVREEGARALVDPTDVHYSQRLPIAIAAAHVGFAALKTASEDARVRRFVFAHAIRHLAEWHRDHRGR